MNLREDLIAHERAASSVYEKEKHVAPANGRFGFYENLKTAADLADYVANAFSTESSKQREAFYISKGFRSYQAILSDHKDEIAHSKKTTIHDIEPGDLLSAYEICSISRNYDLMHGMAINSKDDPDHPFACLRSQIGGVYPDQITEDERFFKYSLEKERDENFASANFKKPVNRILYQDFLRQDLLSQALQIPAHLFLRHSSREKYIYRGVYFVNSLVDENKVFELIRDSFVVNPKALIADDKQMLETFKKDRRAFFQRLYSRVNNPFVQERRLMEVDPSNINFEAENTILPTINGYESIEQMVRDYIEETLIQQQIGDLGEQLVKEFEVARVKKFAPQQVRNIAKVPDLYGYDFDSFEIKGKNIRKIHIEVKTTSDRNPLRKFFMSDNEVKTMNAISDTYWLYRVYDVNSQEPLFYALREMVKDRIKLQAADYTCQIIN